MDKEALNIKGLLDLAKQYASRLKPRPPNIPNWRQTPSAKNPNAFNLAEWLKQVGKTAPRAAWDKTRGAYNWTASQVPKTQAAAVEWAQPIKDNIKGKAQAAAAAVGSRARLAASTVAGKARSAYDDMGRPTSYADVRQHIGAKVPLARYVMPGPVGAAAGVTLGANELTVKPWLQAQNDDYRHQLMNSINEMPDIKQAHAVKMAQALKSACNQTSMARQLLNKEVS